MNKVYQKVEGHPSLLREKNSKAILSTDIAALNEYRAKKALATRVDHISDDINILKREFGEIKSMLLKILENNR